MESAPTIYPEERALLQRLFSLYDTNADGKISQDEFAKGVKEMIGLKKEEAQTIFKSISKGSDVLEFDSLMAVYANEIRGSHEIGDIIKAVKSHMPQFGDLLSSHQIKVNLGQIDDLKTQIGLKISIDQEETTQMFTEAAKGLKLQKDKIAILLKFYTDKPAETKEKLEKIIKSGMAVIKNTMIKPNTPEALAISSIKFEYGTEDNSVVVAAYLEHKGLIFLIEYINLFYDKLQVHKVKGTFEFKLGTKHSFHRLIDEDPATRNLIQVLKEGFLLNAQAKTNADKLLRDLLRPKYSGDLDPPQFALLAFLNKGSKVELSLDELDLDCFIPKNQISPVAHGGGAIPPIDLLDESGYNPLGNGIKGGIAFLQEFKLPIVQNLLDLLENYLKADLELSLNIPHIFVNLRLKTSGLKEVYQRLKGM